MEKRKVKIIYNTSGSGSLSGKISLPKKWIDKMGFTEEERNAIIYYIDNSIIIEKEKREKEEEN